MLTSKTLSSYWCLNWVICMHLDFLVLGRAWYITATLLAFSIIAFSFGSLFWNKKDDDGFFCYFNWFLNCLSCLYSPWTSIFLLVGCLVSLLLILFYLYKFLNCLSIITPKYCVSVGKKYNMIEKIHKWFVSHTIFHKKLV